MSARAPEADAGRGVVGSRTMGSAPLVLLAAALAGVTTLAVELLWLRGLGRCVGTTYDATAVVIGLILAGLGLGSWWGTRAVGTTMRPARGAAVCLLVAGTWVAVSPALLGPLADFHLALLDLLGTGAGGGLLAALLVGIPLVLPASLALGRAFPLLVRGREVGVERAGARAGGVVAVNTLGAVLGVVLALGVLESGGEAFALRLAGGCALAGALLLLLADGPGTPAPATPPSSDTRRGGLGALLALSGAAALIAQLAWLRLLQPLAGPHVLGAALLLLPILLALALGAALGARLADRLRRPGLLFPAALVGAGGFTLLSLPLAGRAPLWLVAAGPDVGERLLALAGVFALATMPATVCFGALLPAAVRVRAQAVGSTAGPAGRLFGANALGALLGSALAGGLLLPGWGAERTLLAAALLVLAAAAWMRWRLGGARRRTATVLCAAPLLLLAVPGVLSGWLASGPTVPELIVAGKPLPPGLTLRDRADLTLYASIWGGRRAEHLGREGAVLLPLYEGRAGRVSLIEEPSGVVGLRRDALRESVFDPDRADVPAATEYALGLLPALMAPRAKRALVIGHGAGWTAEAVLAASDARVDVAEIDEAVLDAARAWRGLERLPVEASDRAQIVRLDGRVVLRQTARRPADEHYDLVASQPSHPWHPGSGHLFTEEAYAAARDALTPDGVMAQWLNLFDLTPELLESALASFRAVFPEMWVYRFPDELVLLGFRTAPVLDTARWEAFFAPDEARSENARRAGFRSAPDLWKHMSLDKGAMDRVLTPGTPTLHDDLPRLELTLAWRRLSRAPPSDAQALLLRGFPPDFEALVPQAAVRERWLTGAIDGWLDEGAPGEAHLWATGPRWGISLEARLARARAAEAAGEPKVAAAVLEGARAEWPARSDVAAAWVRSMKHLVPGMDRRERFQFSQAIEGMVEGPFRDDGPVLVAAAQYRRALGEMVAARALFERALAAQAVPAPPGTAVQLARLLLTGAYGPDTEHRAIQLLASDEQTYGDIDLLDLLVRLTSAAGDEERAQSLEKALSTLQRARGLGLVRTARHHLARHDFQEAVAVANAARSAWSMQPAVHELAGLAMLAAMAAARAGGLPVDLTIEDAVRAFYTALELERDPTIRRARIERMLRWYGLDPTVLPQRRKPGAE